MPEGPDDADGPELSVVVTGPAGKAAVLPGPWRAIPTPITELPHLAAAARARGDTERVIWVEATPPPVIHTPGRVPNQWLESGEFLQLPTQCPVCGWWRDGACQCDTTKPGSQSAVVYRDI